MLDEPLYELLITPWLKEVNNFKNQRFHGLRHKIERR